MIGRQSGDHRPTDGQYLVSVYRRPFDNMSLTDRLAIVGRLTPDGRATFGRYHDENFLKSRPIVGQSPGDHRPTLHRWQNSWKPADRSRKLLTWLLRQKKLSADQIVSQNRCRYRRQSADVARFSQFSLTDRRATFGFGNVTVALQVLLFSGQIRQEWIQGGAKIGHGRPLLQ